MNNFNKIRKIVYIWFGIFIIIPTILLLVLSLSNTNGFRLEGIEFTFEHFEKLSEKYVLVAIINSIKYSVITTLICIVIAFPFSYFLHKMTSKKKRMILILVVIPAWSNMLLRVIAWESIFYPNSYFNIIGISLDLIGSDLAIITVMVSIYLPFMIFPIFSAIDKIDNSVIEASRDLGCTELETIKKVYIPLSKSGIISGIIMVLLPSATGFVIPQRISGGKELLIGNVIEQSFVKTNNFNFGSLLSLILLLIMFILLFIIYKQDKDGESVV